VFAGSLPYAHTAALTMDTALRLAPSAYALIPSSPQLTGFSSKPSRSEFEPTLE
jgi:hypothetical protein